MNISQAANLAATKAFEKLADQAILKTEPFVFLDGGLYLKNDWRKKLKVRTVIRGDENIDAVKLASIVAKVSRDALMVGGTKNIRITDFRSTRATAPRTICGS